MDSNRDIILKKQERRYRLLIALGKAVHGKELQRVNFDKVAAEAGFDKDEAHEIYIYLWKEELFGSRDVGGGVSLSHRAI